MWNNSPPDSSEYIGTNTIVAQASAKGRSGVSVIRVSGTLVSEIAESILGRLPSPRVAFYSKFSSKNKKVIDLGLAIYFPGPNSFTGEDVIEFHGHGGVYITQLLIKEILSLGAKIASPGEFTMRAFLNEKMDLAQAEAVADVIDAASEASAKSALRSLEGVFSAKINELLKSITDLRVIIEACFDFPEEDIDFLAELNVKDKIFEIINCIDSIKNKAKQGVLLKEGVTLAIVGQPNVGKSTLLNSLSGIDSAIVTNIAGTTRDLIKESIQINGVPINLVDTAGLCETSDVVEKQGINRSLGVLEKADHILYVCDSTENMPAKFFKIIETYKHVTTKVVNKIDLSGKKPCVDDGVVYICAKNNDGIEQLKDHLLKLFGYKYSSDQFIARRRHVDALKRTRDFCQKAYECFANGAGAEFMAYELKQAQLCISEITGAFTSDDLLGEIFSNFCIGK